MKLQIHYDLDKDALPAIKSCPFCGKQPALIKDIRWPRGTEETATGIDAFEIVCITHNCPIYHADNTYFLTIKEAVAAWNKREYQEP